MFWGIAPESGLIWGCEPMDLVSRIVGHEPRHNIVQAMQAPLTRSRKFPRPGLARPAWARIVCQLLAVLMLSGLAGCQSMNVPLAQWRAGYDSGLSKKITKEETKAASSEKVEEPRTLLGRWLNPQGSDDVKDDDEATKGPSSKSSSTLVLGSDGWRPMLKPRPIRKQTKSSTKR
jgi:hypothetical protein